MLSLRPSRHQRADSKLVCLQVIGRVKGRELEGRTYEPILPYYEQLKAKGAFRVR